MHINRGKLKRDIEKGLIEGRLSFHIGYDDSTSDVYGKETDPWKPVRIIKGIDDFVIGQINIPEFSFSTKSGHSYKDEKGFINFGAHSNENIILRYRKK